MEHVKSILFIYLHLTWSDRPGHYGTTRPPPYGSAPPEVCPPQAQPTTSEAGQVNSYCPVAMVLILLIFSFPLFLGPQVGTTYGNVSTVVSAGAGAAIAYVLRSVRKR